MPIYLTATRATQGIYIDQISSVIPQNPHQPRYPFGAAGALAGTLQRAPILAIADQGIVSGASFLFTLLIGRFASSEQLGLYSLAISIVLTLLAVQMSLVTMPFAVRYHATTTGKGYAGATLRMQLWLMLAVAGAGLIAWLASAGAMRLVMAVLCVAAPALMFREFWRRMAYARLSVVDALLIDLPVAVLQTGALVALIASASLNAATALVSLSAAAGVGAIIAIVRWRRQMEWGDASLGEVARRHWQFGRWIAAAQVLAVVSTQGVFWLVDAVRGTGETGVYAACLAVVLLSNPFVLAVGNILTPRAAKTLAEDGPAALRRLIVRACALIAIVLGPFCVVLGIWGDPIMQLVYGAEYAGHGAVIAILSVTFTISAIGMAVNDGLRAAGRTHVEFAAMAIDTALTFVLGFVALRWWGLTGLAIASLVGAAAAAGLQIIAFTQPVSLAAQLPRFRRAKVRLDELASRESWSATQMRQWQLDQLNTLWQRCSASVPYYRRLAADHRLPPRFDSLEHYFASMPLLAKQIVRQSPDEFVSAAAPRGKWHFTSGSTGMPMRFFRSAKTHQLLLAHQYRFRQMWGLDLFDRAAFLGAMAPGGRTAQVFVDQFRNRLRLGVHELSPPQLAQHLDRIEQFQPAYLYGYSRAIHMLALAARERGFRCSSLRVVIMTSEPAFQHMIETVASSFDAKAIVEYGSVECGVLAYEWPDRRLRVRSDHAIVETLPRDDGHHDLVVTVLDNPDFPLLRYRIEDLTGAPLSDLEHAFPALQEIAGRNDDLLTAADGEIIHPTKIDGLFEYGSQPQVRRYRVHQHADGRMVVEIEPAQWPAKIDKQTIAAAIASLVRGFPVQVEIVDSIAQTRAGKHRLITSDYRPAAT